LTAQESEKIEPAMMTYLIPWQPQNCILHANYFQAWVSLFPSQEEKLALVKNRINW
jgi:hypothetical protein